MAEHKARVNVSFIVTIDDDLRGSLSLSDGSAQDERDELKIALEDDAAVDWSELIETAAKVKISVEPVID